MAKRKDGVVGVRLSQAEKAELKRIAQEEERTMSGQIRKVLRDTVLAEFAEAPEDDGDDDLAEG